LDYGRGIIADHDYTVYCDTQGPEPVGRVTGIAVSGASADQLIPHTDYFAAQLIRKLRICLLECVDKFVNINMLVA
jgi:hypothetical protein